MNKGHNLQFNVAQLLKEGTGASRVYEVEAEINSELPDITLLSPLVGQVKFLCTGQNILVTSLLKAKVEKSCGRCLAPFTTAITIELEEEFFPSIDVDGGSALVIPDDADEANRIDEQHILDLQEVVRQEFWLARDNTRLYCRPNCKGLCPHCGQDLNVGTCNCQNEAIDSRWAGLLKIGSKE